MNVQVCVCFVCLCLRSCAYVLFVTWKKLRYLYSHLFSFRTVVARALKSHPILSEKLPFSQHPQPQSSSLCIPFFHANEISNTNFFRFLLLLLPLPFHSILSQPKKKLFFSIVSVSTKNYM